MKKIVCITLILVTFFAVPGLADREIFAPEINRYADKAIQAWLWGNTKKLEFSLSRLSLNETYLMAVGQSNENRSYLNKVPVSLNQNPEAVAAYLMLLQIENKGISLWPKSFFEGKNFEIIEIKKGK